MSVGPALRRARTERKLSVADVTAHTKIQPWVLEALESDRLQELMSPVYVKGFLTTYAKFLHLEPASLLAQLAWPAPEPAQAPLPPTSSPMPFSIRLRLPRPLHPRFRSAVAIVAVVAGLIVLNPLRRMPQPSAPSPQKLTKSLPVHPATKPSAPPALKLASVTAVSEPVKPPAPPTATLLASQPLELMVSAHRTTWIKVWADGKLLTQQRLARGANERWTAKKQFALIVSKPSQVELTLNGQSISPFAIAHHGRVLITHRGITRLPDED